MTRRTNLNVEGQLHLIPLVVPGLPVGDAAHAGLTRAEALAERAELRLRVPAAVRVVETHVQEERSGKLKDTYAVTIFDPDDDKDKEVPMLVP